MTSSNKTEADNKFRIALITVITQVGCITPVIILAALFMGIWLDDYLSTRPLFTILFVLVGAPLSLYVVYRIARTATNRLNPEVANNIPQSSEEENSRGA